MSFYSIGWETKILEAAPKMRNLLEAGHIFAP